MAAILVVEDEVDLCNLIRTKLEAEGHSVFQAFDGPTALSLVEVHRPHLVILDWMLPGLDGLAVCRQLRQHYVMPIIMLTARTEEIDRVLGLEVGADDYISKPFSIRELLARVRAVLRRVELDSRSSSPVSNRTNGGAQLIAPSQDASNRLCACLILCRSSHKEPSENGLVARRAPLAQLAPVAITVPGDKANE